MATKREFLVTLGLAKEGRGKFSAAAHAALAKAESEGVVFDEPVKPEPKPKAARVTVVPAKVSLTKPATETVKADSTVTADPLPVGPRPTVRPEKTLYAVSPVGTSHVRIGYDICFSCSYSVQTCTCRTGPKPPAGAIPVPSYPKV